MDHDILWNIISQNLPPLIGRLEAFLAGDQERDSDETTARE